MQMQAPSEETAGEQTQRVGFWLGLLLFVALLLLPPPESMQQAARQQFAKELPGEIAAILKQRGQAGASTDSAEYQRAAADAVTARAACMMSAAAVTALTACWWITVAIPIPVTSLLPLLLFPLVGVLPVEDAASPYADASVFLFMGGFIIALGIERWGLHRRIALHIVRIIGTSRTTIVLGFMVASAAISMWISNTATAMMMLPIGLAVIAALPGLSAAGDARDRQNFAAALMLGIAYAASIGGMGTPIGTPPNIVFRGQLARLFPDAPEVSFGQWMLLFVPLMVVFIPVSWLILVRVTCRFSRGGSASGREAVRQELARLGRLRGPEAAVLVLFVLTAVLWMTRSIPVRGNVNYGWAPLLETWLAPADGTPHHFRAAFVSDATVAIAVAALLFVWPAGRDGQGRRRFLMDWETAQRLPWGILLLFGGGFAIAAGFQVSGLSLWCGQEFASLGITNPLVLVVGTCLLITFVSEIASNTATAQLMLPIVANVSQALGLNPLLLMLAATMSASLGFMLPVATPPNAIAFGSGYIAMGRMVRSGLILDLVGVALVTATMYLLGRPVLGIDPGVVPAWAG